ncbi:type II secretion system F family protein [Caproiciproducens galactitolivorans]|uniref:Bacterial type II secretion system protein F domain protein n=1 Tax=Caproiciproducens galactitolivorans TaxID=642589 RepID=A0A4Z0YKU9_9FIRM|nr:type II secretion system F family protein [Caproiciproducens galactitolivorans]QEY35681.1 type II secretion system F family protein [Caproiciproducens galactitolivorans]TGJ77412.1 bacterial type II secretion system protein F domain protein [Caproiciproducens galactitolivorans]
MQAICSGVLAYLLVLLFFGRKEMKAERLQKRMAAINSGGSDSLNEESTDVSFFDRILKPFVNRIIVGISKLIPKTPKNLQKINARLRLAGIHMKDSEYQAMVILVTLSCGALGGFYGLWMGQPPKQIILFVLYGILAGYILNRFKLESAITRRKEAMASQLPELLDLLSVSMEAGLGFDQAVQYVTKNNEGPLAEELAVALREMTLGKSRKDALRSLAQRCEVEEVKTFVGVVVQADEYGFSLKDILRAQADTVRMAHKQEVKEKSMKIPIKILFPLVLFIFPALFIVLLGPSVLSIMKMFTEI